MVFFTITVFLSALWSDGLSMMKMLVLTNNPQRASFRQRIEVYLDLLRRNGISCQVAQFPRQALARWRLLRNSREYDAVFLQKRRLNILDARMLRHHAKKIIYDFDDAVMYDPEAPERNSLSRALPFHRTVRIADLVIAGNSYLAEHARKFSANVEVLPTGLDTKSYAVNGNKQCDGKVRLVWIGSRNTLPYLFELRPVLEDLASRRAKVILRIISDEFFELKNMPVEKCPWSVSTQYVDLAASDIGLAPLPDNRFTRGKCGFKILQYAAAGVPTVASPVGVSAQYVQDGVTGFLASEPGQWTQRISELLDRPDLRLEMGTRAREFVRAYDASVIGEQLANLLRRYLGVSNPEQYLP